MNKANPNMQTRRGMRRCRFCRTYSHRGPFCSPECAQGLNDKSAVNFLLHDGYTKEQVLAEVTAQLRKEQ